MSKPLSINITSQLIAYLNLSRIITFSGTGYYWHHPENSYFFLKLPSGMTERITDEIIANWEAKGWSTNISHVPTSEKERIRGDVDKAVKEHFGKEVSGLE